MSSSSRKMLQAAAGVGGDFYPYTVDNSARFERTSADYLSRTIGTSGNRKTWTLSYWYKPTDLDNWQYQFSKGTSTDFTYIAHTVSTTTYGMRLLQNVGNITQVQMQPTMLLRDSSAWYHIVWAIDTTQATTANRVRLYVNGVEVTSWQTATYPSQNYDFYWGQSSTTHYIGKHLSNYTSGYFSQIAIVFGSQLAPSSFGEDKNGVWVPKDLSGLTFGAEGTLLDFSNSAALGTDVSGNGNNFTSSGLTSSDQMIDTPTHNNVTWLPTYRFGGSYYNVSGTMSDGNLTASVNTYSQIAIASSVLPSTGKWYWEIEVDTVAAMGIGMTNTRYLNAISSNQTLHFNNGGSGNSVYIEGSIVTTYGTSWTTGDVIGVYFNADDGEISWYKNGTAMDSSPYSLSYSDGWIPYIAQLSGAGTCVGTLVTDENKFNHTPPTDALSLSTANLPEPTIGPNSDTTSDENFNTVLYTGNGSTQSVTGVNFQPDFTWIKNRDGAYSHWLNDAVRGAGLSLASNTNEEEKSYGAYFTAFDSDGFSLAGGTPGFNASGNDYVGWNWKANGSGVTNNDGTVTSTVSVNQDAGFSIITYPYGQGSAGHGLGAIPDFLIYKERSPNVNNWFVWHKDLSGSDYFLYLDNTGAESNPYGDIFNLTSTTFGTNSGLTGRTGVAYAFVEVEGFSKFGKYTGNGSATDGPFIYTGFRPAYVIFKRTDSTSDWNTHDASRSPYNVSDDILWADLSDAETTGSSTGKLDFLSNGIKIRGSANGINTSGGTYIYMAFAESPFKYANAR
jgi:hypothetical protein